MPFIHTSRTQLDRPPPGVPRLNAAHDFAQGMRLWVPNANYEFCGYPSHVPLVLDDSSGTATATSADNGKTSAWEISDSANKVVTVPVEYHQVTNITGDQLTLQCWVRPSVTGLNWIVAKPYKNTLHANPYTVYSILQDDTTDIGMRFGTDVWRPSTTGTVTTGKDSHVAVTYDGANVRLYVDGQQYGADYALTGNITPTFEDTRFLIGCNAIQTEEFTGDIWGVTLSDKAWRPDEIFDHAHGARYALFWSRTVSYFLPPVGAAPPASGTPPTLGLMGVGV